MSLIHEALRRADEDQCRRDAGAETPGPPPLSPDDGPPPPARRSPWRVPLAAVLVIFAGAAAYAVWWGIGAARDEAGLAVQSAVASLQQTARTGPAGQQADTVPVNPPAAAATETAAPPDAVASLPEQPADSTAGAAAQAGPSGTGAALAVADGTAAAENTQPSVVSAAGAGETSRPTPETDHAGAWTPDLRLKTLPDAATPKDGAADGGAESALFDRMLAVLETAAREAARRQAEAATGASAADNTSDDPPLGAPRGHGTSPKAGPAPAQAKPGDPAEAPKKTPSTAAPKPAEPEGPVIDTSKVKISSIMVGPNGNLAVINGRPVRVGDSILGATVVGITSRSVEVEKDGRRATIGL